MQDDAPTTPAPRSRPRRLLGLAILLCAAAVLLALPRLFAPPAAENRVSVDGLPPFERLAAAGDLSSAGGAPSAAVLVGLDAGPAIDPDALAAFRDDPCGVLFRGADGGDAVPVAYFSDVRCPWCRIMETRLAELGADVPDVRLVEHELPVFGAASETAARAILAAGEAAGPLRERLRGAAAVTDARYVQYAAEAAGLDPDALAARMGAEPVARQLALSRAAARALGLAGTPGLVVGRTVVSGAIPSDTLARIVAEERDRGGPVCAP